jgi:hypothetical protein
MKPYRGDDDDDPGFAFLSSSVCVNGLGHRVRPGCEMLTDVEMSDGAMMPRRYGKICCIAAYGTRLSNECKLG